MSEATGIPAQSDGLVVCDSRPNPVARDRLDQHAISALDRTDPNVSKAQDCIAEARSAPLAHFADLLAQPVGAYLCQQDQCDDDEQNCRDTR